MMKTYNITMMNLTRKQVLDQILSVHSGVTFQVKPNAEEEAPKKPNGKKRHASNDDVLVLTGKHATKGSAREKILLTLEKMEVKTGIGSVTRKMLRDECSKQGQDAQIIYQLIREGYMKKAGE